MPLLSACPWGAAPQGCSWVPCTCKPREFLLLDCPCCPPLLPFFPFYFCNRFQGGITRTMHSTMDAALCIGTFSVSLLIISCCLAGYLRMCASTAAEVPSVSPRLLLWMLMSNLDTLILCMSSFFLWCITFSRSFLLGVWSRCLRDPTVITNYFCPLFSIFWSVVNQWHDCLLYPMHMKVLWMYLL